MCLGAGPPGPVIRAVLPAAGGPSDGPGPSPSRFHTLGDSVSAQIVNSQFGTIKEKKKKQQGRGEGGRVRAGKFSSDLSEIIFSPDRGQPSVSRFPSLGCRRRVSAGPARERSQACAAAETLINAARSSRGQAEGERERERQGETEGWSGSQRDGERDGERRRPRQTWSQKERETWERDRRTWRQTGIGEMGRDEERDGGETDRQTTDWQGL